MVKHTQTIRRQFASELFECVWPLCDIGIKRVKTSILNKIFRTIFNKIWNHKSLKSAFAWFLTIIVNFIFLEERVRSRVCFLPILRFFYNLKLLENLIGNLYIKLFLLDIKFGFNCEKSNLYKTSVKFQYILPRIVWKLLYFPLWTVNNLWFFPNPQQLPNLYLREEELRIGCFFTQLWNIC